MRKGKKIFAFLGLFVVVLFFVGPGRALYNFNRDTWCLTTHKTSSTLPANAVTSEDYFSRGNYYYDAGNCQTAVANYTSALALNPNYAEAFNNRAYTYMRMQKYTEALSDLNQALTLRPNYVNALMNRSDIYNFYLKDREKAIEGYNEVMKLDPYHGSICGHRGIALNGGMTLGLYFKMLFNSNIGCQL